MLSSSEEKQVRRLRTNRDGCLDCAEREIDNECLREALKRIELLSVGFGDQPLLEIHYQARKALEEDGEVREVKDDGDN